MRFILIWSLAIFQLWLSPSLLNATGRGALVALEGEAGRKVIQTIISANPSAKQFFSEVLGVKPSQLMTMDPAIRQTQLLNRLSGKNADQTALRKQADAFIRQYHNSSQLNQQDITLKEIPLNSESEAAGEIAFADEFDGNMSSKLKQKTSKRLPVAGEPNEGELSKRKLKQFVDQMITRGEITAVKGKAFEQAVLTTDVEGSDVIRCISEWKKVTNRSLYVDSIIEGAKGLSKSNQQGLEAIANTIVRGKGVSLAEAKRRTCLLAGAGTIRCNAYGQPIFDACQ